MIKRELKNVKVGDLIPYEANPHRNNKSAKIVAKSIETYGYINPILVTDKNIILAGHTRLKALKLLGIEEVEVLVISGLSEEQIHGLAMTNDWGKYSDEFRKMMNYVRDCGKKVHLLGCQNVDTFKTVKPDTIDYSIFQYAINLAHAKKEHPN